MNIAFVANYNLTYFFEEIGMELSNKYSINIYWIVVNEDLYKFLKTRYPTSKLLYLSINSVLKTKYPVIGEYKINEIIYGDRVLKYDYKLGVDFLTNVQHIVYEFIKSNSVSFVFGEITWAHEVLICRILKDRTELNCKYLSPFTIRIPENRFAFFEDEFQEKIFVKNKNINESVEFLENVFIPKKPKYLELLNEELKNSYSLKNRINRIKNFISGKNLDKNDITLPKKGSLSRVLIPVVNEINKETYKLINKKEINFLINKKFILITLHKQPESSIDNFGRYVEDQKANIVNIWRQLPLDWYIVVKEHSNAVGDRSYRFYKDLLKYNNLIFIDEKIDSYALLDICQAVFTVSGTIAYEAAIKNVKAFTFCDIFFNQLSYVRKIDIYNDFRNNNIQDLINSLPKKNCNDQEFKAIIYANSFDGIISDPISDPDCLERSNIIKVSSAFYEIIINN